MVDAPNLVSAYEVGFDLTMLTLVSVRTAYCLSDVDCIYGHCERTGCQGELAGSYGREYKDQVRADSVTSD